MANKKVWLNSRTCTFFGFEVVDSVCISHKKQNLCITMSKYLFFWIYNYFEQNLAPEKIYNISMVDNLKSASTKNTANLLEI